MLSSGHVIETDRTKLVGEYLGVTEKNTLNAIRSASGGVLFIDEAYSLSVQDGEKKDFGMRVIETLLTYLGSDDTDMIVILAGYTQEMQKMLDANPGMKSRFPYIFHFDDWFNNKLKTSVYPQYKDIAVAKKEVIKAAPKGSNDALYTIRRNLYRHAWRLCEGVPFSTRRFRLFYHTKRMNSTSEAHMQHKKR